MARYYYDVYYVETYTVEYDFRNPRYGGTFQHSFPLGTQGGSYWDFDTVRGFIVKGSATLSEDQTIVKGGGTSVYEYFPDGTAVWYTCDYSTYTNYYKGDYIKTIVAEEGMYPDDGRKDGYWYVKRDRAFPRVQSKINGELVDIVAAQVKIEGELRDIVRIEVKKDGELVEL